MIEIKRTKSLHEMPITKTHAYMSDKIADKLKQHAVTCSDAVPLPRFCGLEMHVWPVGTELIHPITAERFVIDDHSVFMAVAGFRPMSGSQKHE